MLHGNLNYPQTVLTTFCISREMFRTSEPEKCAYYASFSKLFLNRSSLTGLSLNFFYSMLKCFYNGTKIT